MIRVTTFEGRTVAVLGLARSGMAAVRALLDGGAKVLAWDDNEDRRTEAHAIGAEIVDLVSADWSNITSLVMSPGIPLTHPKPHPAAAAAKAASVEIIGDIELLLRARPDATLVAITGTNGKSTTTALVGHILHHAGRTAEIGGNIGKPALELEPLGHGGVYVLEFSSYQLDLTPSLSADVSVLINLSPDHLDRHGGMDGYIRAKTRVFTGQRDGATAIIGVDDADCRKLSAGLSNPIAISGRQQIVGGVHVHDSQLVDDRGGAGRVMLDMLEAPALPGDHNAQNAAAAAAVTLSLGLDREAVARGIASFPGLAHRQERVAEISGVLYINDSKATNAEAAAHALACYDAIYWILGGLGKEGGLTPLADKLAPVRHAFLIGAASEQFATELDGQVPTTSCGTLDLALEKAHRMAQDEHPSGATVLLSPAAASFDQFPDFEARGDRFRTLVHARMAS